MAANVYNIIFRAFLEQSKKITPSTKLQSARGKKLLAHILKVTRKKLIVQIRHLEKRLRNGWRKRQATLVVSHKARP